MPSDGDDFFRKLIDVPTFRGTIDLIRGGDTTDAPWKRRIEKLARMQNEMMEELIVQEISSDGVRTSVGRIGDDGIERRDDVTSLIDALRAELAGAGAAVLPVRNQPPANKSTPTLDLTGERRIVLDDDE